MTPRILLFVFLAAVTAWGCTPDGASGESGAAAETAAAPEATGETEIVPGLTMRRLKNGYGRAAVAGDLASERRQRLRALLDRRPTDTPAQSVQYGQRDE